MNNNVEKAIKGLFLAVVFGAITYFLLKEVVPAALMAIIMFSSMFVKQKEYGQQNNMNYGKKNKKRKK